MDVFRVTGSRPLRGSIQTCGAKNAALPLFAAALLTDETVTIENVPELSDIRFMADIMRHLGATVERTEPTTWAITAGRLTPHAPYDLVRKMRASVCLMGPLIARLRSAVVSLPGGCVIGPRPIDLHLKGFAGLGCGVSIEGGYVHIDGRHLRGADLFLGGRHGSTALGTVNVLMAAVLAPGTTRIESAACEPEVVDVCRMLVAMGAKIEGIGSHALVVEGVERLHGATHRVIPDRIEAGTYLLAGAITGGDVTVEGARASDLAALLDKLRECGVPIEAPRPDCLRVRADLPHTRRAIDVITMPHPGFATDLQAQMCALMSVTPGLSILTEKVFPNRFMHVPELQRMGADIAIEGPSAIVKGLPRLSGAPVMASDLRASAALVLAALAAHGESWIQRVYHIDRGYERIDLRLQKLGASIERLPAEAMPRHLSAE
ncbi:UDP-N-acetylglucosamine 1-carboxyvinyltransferase [Opitutales bacterium ASA1]|uniref:UDP-N-acetylglucosamine 1-carboxyvinyltransferase n=1 Tax=Congregicoccus parvus TaxID=3081749 RepID=UPI002B323B18|nr:UDP-N-acetylglucosamine 1-carboxyvinyltransferase [Opitutales bacterium ASA1]